MDALPTTDVTDLRVLAAARASRTPATRRQNDAWMSSGSVVLEALDELERLRAVIASLDRLVEHALEDSANATHYVRSIAVALRA